MAEAAEKTTDLAADLEEEQGKEIEVVEEESQEVEAVEETEEDSDVEKDEKEEVYIEEMVGIMDPPRAEVYDAIARCQKAGIHVKIMLFSW